MLFITYSYTMMFCLYIAIHVLNSTIVSNLLKTTNRALIPSTGPFSISAQYLRAFQQYKV